MAAKEQSFVKTCSDYFGRDRKVTFEEFKSLSPKDRAELRDMLIAEGYSVAPLGEALSQ